MDSKFQMSTVHCGPAKMNDSKYILAGTPKRSRGNNLSSHQAKLVAHTQAKAGFLSKAQNPYAPRVSTLWKYENWKRDRTNCILDQKVVKNGVHFQIKSASKKCLKARNCWTFEALGRFGSEILSGPIFDKKWQKVLYGWLMDFSFYTLFWPLFL